SLFWGLDNVMHTSENEVNIRLKNGEFELKPTLSRGEWGLSQDDAGRMYRNTNESALHVDLVPTPYFERNPSLVRTLTPRQLSSSLCPYARQLRIAGRREP